MEPLIMNLKKIKRTLLLLLPLLFAACSGEIKDTERVEGKREITIATSVGDFGTMVKEFVAPELKKRGYRVTLLEITDILAPNIGLLEGAIDINTYQHRAFLNSFNESRGSNLIPIFQIPTGPLGLYGGKKVSLEEVERGSSIALPADSSNYARALILLQDLGWIRLNPETDPIKLQQKDVIENPHQLNFVEVESPQIPRVRRDLDYAIITGNFAASSGIPFREALFTDPNFDFINWAVIRPEDQDAPWVKEIEEI